MITSKLSQIVKIEKKILLRQFIKNYLYFKYYIIFNNYIICYSYHNNSQNAYFLLRQVP